MIEAVQTQGMKKAHAARMFGVSRQGINNWLAAHERDGDAALAAKPQGRPKEGTIAPKQQAKIVLAIRGKCPEQLKLPFALWTREAVVGLIKIHTGRHGPVRDGLRAADLGRSRHGSLAGDLETDGDHASRRAAAAPP